MVLGIVRGRDLYGGAIAIFSCCPIDQGRSGEADEVDILATVGEATGEGVEEGWGGEAHVASHEIGVGVEHIGQEVADAVGDVFVEVCAPFAADVVCFEGFHVCQLFICLVVQLLLALGYWLLAAPCKGRDFPPDKAAKGQKPIARGIYFIPLWFKACWYRVALWLCSLSVLAKLW